jgi:hypothetical protein
VSNDPTRIPSAPSLNLQLPLNRSGDSYSDVGYSFRCPHPTLENPLGVKYPGFTWAGFGEPNWVGHLITEYNPNGALLVYDFARGGDTIAGVQQQVRNQFLPVLAPKPEWAPWTAEDSLFGMPLVPVSSLFR